MPKRPQQAPNRLPLTEADIQQAAYVGSAEHKQARWWGELPGAYVGPDGRATRPKKQLTTVCPLTDAAARDRATEWVQVALRARHYHYYDADQTYPKKLWYRDADGQVWSGFCVNSQQGQYKGWPIDEDERVEIFG
jgi:hypothetical protein